MARLVSNKKLLWLGLTLVGCVVIALGVWWLVSHLPINSSGAESVSDKYTTDVQARVVRKLADDLGFVTRVKLTPDEQQMFVTNLAGQVWVFENKDGRFVKQDTPLYQIDLGWQPGAENGLTGLIVSADYLATRNIFLLYAKSTDGKTGVNQVLRLRVERQGDKYIGVEPKEIFTANAPAAGAHQIQGGFAVKRDNKSHLVFAIGENYRASDAKDLTKEAGKIIMIQEDGSNPTGVRPYPNQPKIQVIGIRNVYDLVRDTENDWVYWTENGPDSNDRVVYAPILDGSMQFDGNWDDKGESLATVLVNGKPAPEYIVKLWSSTVAPTDIVADNIGRFYVNIFSSATNPTKEILMGEKIKDAWNLKPIITRLPSASGGNLLGLALSSKGDFYFGDFADGAIYVMTKSWSKI